MNEVFYEYKEIKAKDDLSSELNIEIILHFLSKVEEVILLYETKISLRKPSASITIRTTLYSGTLISAVRTDLTGSVFPLPDDLKQEKSCVPFRRERHAAISCVSRTGRICHKKSR